MHTQKVPENQSNFKLLHHKKNIHAPCSHLSQSWCFPPSGLPFVWQWKYGYTHWFNVRTLIVSNSRFCHIECRVPPRVPLHRIRSVLNKPHFIWPLSFGEHASTPLPAQVMWVRAIDGMAANVRIHIRAHKFGKRKSWQKYGYYANRL